MAKNILLIDDEKYFNKNLATNLTQEGYQVTSAFTGEEGLIYAKESPAEITIIDLSLPDMDGIEVLKAINKINPSTTSILITAHGYVEAAVSAMRHGAYDFIEKPFPTDKLKLVIKNALNTADLKKTVGITTKLVSSKYGFESLIGSSKPIKEIIELLNKLVQSDTKMVLITGETGTGKGLATKVLHYNGSRAEKPLIEMNCAAIPENLLESELFGYEAGAFTDARKARSGILEDADKGTILLDEIGDMTLNLQAKLIKVIEERSFRRLGGKKDINIDVQIVAATNRNLKEEVKNGNFREDLYHRLNVISFEMPALRIRKEDIVELTDYFIGYFNFELRKNVTIVPTEMRKTIQAYDWPGNIRELRSTIERAMILSDGDELNTKYIQIEVDDEDIKVENTDSKMNLEISLEDASLDKIEEKIIKECLELNNWNQTKTAKMLGINRQILRYRMKKMGLLN